MIPEPDTATLTGEKGVPVKIAGKSMAMHEVPDFHVLL